MNKIYIWIAGLVIALGALGGAGWYIHTNALQKQRVELLEQHARNLQRVTDSEIELRNKKDAAYEDLQKKLRNSDARANKLSDELRNRPPRTASPSVPPEAGGACTGAGLYRDDALFLNWFSSQTERLKEERNYYYGRYEDARLQLERLKNGKD